MGLGDGLTSVFGGKNNYKFKGPTQMEQGNFDQRLAQNQALINQARNNQQINFNPANQYGADITGIARSIQGGAGNPIDFSAAQGTQAQQQELINQLMAQGRGEGPNPALAQLNMTRDQNAAQAAGFAASQRGLNPALAARMASQNVAQGNQQAAGQAALMSAQQQLAAQGQAGQLIGNQAQQQAAQAQAISQQRLAQQQAAAGMFGNQQQMLGQQAINEAQQKANLEGMRTQADLAYQKQIFDLYNSANAINAGVASQNAATSGQYGMAAMSGLSSMAGKAAAGMYEGGEVQNPFAHAIAQKVKGYAMGGDIQPIPSYSFDQGLSQGFQDTNPMNIYQLQKAEALGDIAKAGQEMRKNMASIGTDYGAKIKGMLSVSGNNVGDFNPGVPSDIAIASDGGKIDGKAKVQGDSPKNDTVPAMLSPGEIVIPRSKVEDPQAAHRFLDEVMSQNKMAPTFDSIIKAKKAYQERSEMFHNLYHGGKADSACGYCNGGMI